MVKRFEIWLVSLDPTKGSEIQKTRPCVIISPNEMNNWLRTIIVAPMTSSIRPYPSRVAIKFDQKSGQIVIDQIRCIDKKRLLKKLGNIPEETATAISKTIIEMFSL